MIYMDLITMIPNLKKTGADEWTGPCPFCGGDDRFVVNMKNGGTGGLYWCRKQDCGAKGDAITYLRETAGLSYEEACNDLGIMPVHSDRQLRGSHFKRVNVTRSQPRRFKHAQLPPEQWMARAASFIEYARGQLSGSEGEAYMTSRGILHDTLTKCGIGYSPKEFRISGDGWGCPDVDRIYIAEGIVIPWVIDDRVIRVNVRRVKGDGKRYQHIKGGRGGMFIAGDWVPLRDTIVCEGEIDAMSLKQTGVVANCIATGSAQGSRDEKSVVRLASSGRLFVALDPDEAGEDGWRFWHKTFRNAVRITPVGGDINEMLINNTLHGWINEQVRNT